MRSYASEVERIAMPYRRLQLIMGTPENPMFPLQWDADG